ncbi:MAG TPA: hypothetical protein VGC79_22365, partial [Polyangiaceae bacterium]
MLKRLVDQADLDESDRQLSELFSSAAPFEVDPFRKRRILVRLSREGGAELRTGAARFWLRPIAIATLLISGTAMAELGHRYVLHGSGFFGLGGSEAPSTSSSNVTGAPRLAATHKPKPSASLGTGSELAPPAPTVSAAPADVAPPEPAASAPRPTPKNARSRAESSEDATHVVQAIQALRTERDPARAQALLNDYLKANPRGALSGDALALSIEAASAQHDPRAAEYARRYLTAYPQGKYRELAKRAL